jgi:hypothetical protein
MEAIQLENTAEVITAHSADECVHDPCPLHHRTDHGMRAWPQHFRGDRYMMERICAHGVGHPDPDDIETSVNSLHGCDLCCVNSH